MGVLKLEWKNRMFESSMWIIFLTFSTIRKKPCPQNSSILFTVQRTTDIILQKIWPLHQFIHYMYVYRYAKIHKILWFSIVFRNQMNVHLKITSNLHF